jgi:hypothetical protein
MIKESLPKMVWLSPMIILGGAALTWLLFLLGLDFLLSFHGPSGTFWSTLAKMSPGDVQQSLGQLPQVVVGILGIAITVVSIILQLAATRYTPRVTEMFFRDRTNLLVMGFFLVASVNGIWATVMVRESFIPYALALLTMGVMTVAILLLAPYFYYVFTFLDPERIVARLQEQALHEALGSDLRRNSEYRQNKVLLGIEQLSDVAINSISQKDRIIASRSVDSLKELVIRYVEKKSTLAPQWFVIGPLLRQNPDFVAMAKNSVDELSESRAWLEWKVLRQYQTIFNDSLHHMRDISQLVAIDTRYIGEKAIVDQDHRVLRLVIKFFNTYLRATINQRDIRTAYNVLHQYRLLAEQLLRQDMRTDLLEVVQHFKYYSQTANACGLVFISETAAYDLCTLCEVAHQVQFPLERNLLGLFLEVDKVPETEAQELSLRGVRKAQIKLATFYLVAGAEDLARLIWKDMEHERPERLQSIREEMLQVENADFWEVIDRGYNFDYLDPPRRKELQTFYSWFPK